MIMRNLLDIKPLHFIENDCIEDQIVSIANWWKNNSIEENILFCYSASWDFSYDTKVESQNKTIGEKLYKMKEIDINISLKKYYGIELNRVNNKDISFLKFISVANTELSENRPVILMPKACYIPWNENYGHYDRRYLHAIILVGIDNDKQQFLFTDGYDSVQNVNVDFQAIENGYVGRYTTLNFYKDFHKFNMNSYKDLFNNAISDIPITNDKDFSNKIEVFAKDIGNLKSFISETKASNGDFVSSKLYTSITDLILGRRKYSILFKYLYNIFNIELFNTLCGEINIAAIKWLKIQRMLVKASFLTEFNKLKERIVDEILYLADYESNILFKIVELHDKFESDINRYKSQIINTFSHFSFIDLTGLYNNKGFGNISKECNANLISDPTRPKVYFLENEAPSNEIIEVGNMKFKFPEIFENKYDNISCIGQEISLSCQPISALMLLGCAEWGDFVEELTIYFDDDTIEKIEITFTDWYFIPCLGETTALRLKHVHFDSNGAPLTSKNDNYISAKIYIIDSAKRVKKIKLPMCPNNHIFAITTTY